MQQRTRWRGWRWIARGGLGLLGVIVAVVGAVLIILHTDWGREKVRAQVEKQLASTFVGGASLGGLEGSPFGDLVLRDLVIRGPDGKPVIAAKRLTVEVGIMPLLSHQARVLAVIAEDLDVSLLRDATGDLAIKHLTKPGPSSGWSVDLPKVQVRRGHVVFDSGREIMNFDALSIDAKASLPHGGPIDAELALTGTWRERGAAPLDVKTSVHSGDDGLSVPTLALRAGDVTVSGNHVTVVTPANGAPLIGGAISVNAGAAAVARLVPQLQLPADVVVSVTAKPVAGQPWTELTVTGKLGEADIKLTGTADLQSKHAKGELSTGALDVTKLSSGAVEGRASAQIVFDVLPGKPGALPTATATIRGWAELAGVPTTTFDIALSSEGERVRATVDATGKGTHANLVANLRLVGDLLAIEDAKLHVQTSDPARASGGKAPVHGSLRADLTASGKLRPTTSLAVTGTVDGKRLRVAGISVASLKMAIDGKQLPNRPYGHAHVEVVDLVRDEMQLGALTLDATDRPDGKIAVTLRSRPKQNPWLIDLDALVTPPAAAKAQAGVSSAARTTQKTAERTRVAAVAPAAMPSWIVDVLGHHIRAGSGADWTGRTGRIEIGPQRIVVRDLDSASKLGRISIDGSFERAGRRSGDFTANIEARSLSLDNLDRVYHGKLDATVAVSRRAGAWDGDVAIDAVGVSIDPSPRLPGPVPGPALATAVAVAAAREAKATPAPNEKAKPKEPALVVTKPEDAKPEEKAVVVHKPATKVKSPVDDAAPTAPVAPTVAPNTAAGAAVNAQTAEAAKPGPIIVDAHARASLHGKRLAVTANAASAGVGAAKIALELDTPAKLTDAAAWQRLGRNAIRTGELTLQGVQVARAAELAGLTGYAGRIDGSIQLSDSTTGGRITAANLVAPALRGPEGVNLVLEVAQTGPTELAPTLTATMAGVGQIATKAEIAMPEKLFDPEAWAALGPRLLKRASVRMENVAVDPAMLDRFGVIAEVRGTLSVGLEVGEGASTVNATVDMVGLRGKLLQPIDVHLAVATDDNKTSSEVTIKAADAPLLSLDAQIPMSLIQLARRFRSDPAGARATPLKATAKLASVDAAKLLSAFGRTEITAGKLDGTLEAGGTLAKPTAKLELVATGLKVPPGPRGKPVRSVDRIAITGSWDGSVAKLDVDGVESEGGTLKIAATVDPASLATGSVTLKASKLDLVPLLVFAPGPAGAASGQLDADITMRGLDLRTTKLSGELHLTDARVPIAPQVGTLRRAKIDAVIGEKEIKLTVNGKLGQGEVKVDGAIALTGASPSGGQAKITLRNVSPIGVVEPKITADITAKLAHENQQWRADLVVDKGFILVPNDRGEKLKPAGPPSDMMFANGERIARRPMAEAAPTNPIFLVTVQLRSTRVESDEVRGLVKGKLEIRADGDTIAVFGGIDADRGDLDLFGHRYYVERAGVHFDGQLDPLLDVRITHDFTDVTTVTEVHGRASDPELTLSSDPGTYSQGELLGFLLGGDPGGDPASGAASDRVAGAGASFVANKLGGYVRDALPVDIDVLRYEAATAATSAAVLVGTWITQSLFIAYRQHLESRPDENTGEGEVEYWLSRRVVLEGTTGNRGYSGLDLLWRKRY